MTDREILEWQPIDTAPKDGTYILVCMTCEANGRPLSGERRALFTQRAAWWEGDGWVVYCDLPNEPRVFFEPTHWMHIPPFREEARETPQVKTGAKVIPLRNITRLDLPVDRVLDGAKDRLEGVVIMGYTTDGEEYFASTYADAGVVLWLMERLKAELIKDQE